jgi:O-antigen ligase
MAKKPKKSSLGLTTNGAAIIAILLAALRLSELIPITRVLGSSIQNWRVELYTAVFFVISGVWIYKHRKEASAKLSALDRSIGYILLALVGFTAWGAFSAVWAFSWASVLLHTLTWILFIAATVFSLVVFRTRNGVNAFIAACIVTSTITAAVCLVDYYQVTDAARDLGLIRVKYARLAESFVAFSPLLCISALYVRRKRLASVCVVGWLLSWLLVMLSTSKGAFLAGVVGHVVLFFGCILFSRYPIRKKVAALVGLWLAFTLITQVTHSALSPIPTTTDYLSGEADPTRETTAMRVFTWRIGMQMVAGHPITGVGADNFGINFNPARRAFNRSHSDPGREVAEHYFPERAHNEFVQIAAELGVVGILLFAGAFAILIVLVIDRLRKNRYSLSPILWAAIAGMTAFFASSFVSSFSFRIVQNGVFFFIIFGLALSEVDKMKKAERSIPEKWPGKFLTAAIAGSAVALVLFGLRSYAEVEIRRAESVRALAKALPNFALASTLDPDNFFVHHRVGVRYANEGQHASAAKEIRKMIDAGGGTTLNYTLLADYWDKAGQQKTALETYTEAVETYPNSVFLRAKYAVYLESRGDKATADAQMERAREVDTKQANGWYVMLGGNAPRDILAATGEVEDVDKLLPVDARKYYQQQRDSGDPKSIQRIVK